MYLFEDCPFQEKVHKGQEVCFDPGFSDTFKRHPDIEQNFCRGDFRGCPYYRTQGMPARVPEDTRPNPLKNTPQSHRKHS